MIHETPSNRRSRDLGHPRLKPGAGKGPSVERASSPPVGGLPIPAFRWVRGVVVRPLTRDVRANRLEVGDCDGLGEISALPSPSAEVARAALEMLHQRGNRDSASNARDDVNMVFGVTNGDHLAANAPCALVHETREPRVITCRDRRAPISRRPNDVNDQIGERLSSHCSKIDTAPVRVAHNRESAEGGLAVGSSARSLPAPGFSLGWPTKSPRGFASRPKSPSAFASPLESAVFGGLR